MPADDAHQFNDGTKLFETCNRDLNHFFGEFGQPFHSGRDVNSTTGSVSNGLIR
jgi:hypothetical protein